jgi:hypothetical protein
LQEEIKTSGQNSEIIAEYADSIYAFFLGDKNGIIHKESIFNEEKCPIDILINLVKAFCSFTEETKISDRGTIELSNSKISFRKIQDITYVLNHGIQEITKADYAIDYISNEFEARSRSKFHSADPEQVFSGASAVYNKTVEELFGPVIRKESPKFRKYRNDALLDLELVDVPISFDDLMIISKTPEKPKEIEKTEVKDEKLVSAEEQTPEQMLSAVTFNILGSIQGIDHLMFVEHEGDKAELFFQNGSLDEDFVSKTQKICEKYLSNILEIMEDEQTQNAIDITNKHQIIFVNLDESNFMYAVASKDVDAVLLDPVFERIAGRIKKMVLDYKKKIE